MSGFFRDLGIGQKGEEMVIKSFASHGWTAVERRNDALYDFEMHHTDGRMMQVEVKRDTAALRWGNVYVEFECRGKPSGIAITGADVYVFVIGTRLLCIYTDALKNLMVKYPVKAGGDWDKRTGKKVALGHIVPVSVIADYIVARDEIRN